jgi:hypothetical protein
VLSGYEPDGPGELALQAMLVSATDGDQHFSNFCASLSLHEAGLLESGVGITPKVGTLARPGAAEELADAIRRGAQCTPTSRRSTISRASTSHSRTCDASCRFPPVVPDASGRRRLAISIA